MRAFGEVRSTDFWRREKMKLRSLLMVGALLLGGCAVNPYGGTPAPVGEPDKPVSQP